MQENRSDTMSKDTKTEQAKKAYEENEQSEEINVVIDDQPKKDDAPKSKKKKLNKQAQELEKLKDENGTLRDQLLRKMAEFENYRKRTERDSLNVIQNANENLIKRLLPVFDDLERSLVHARQSDDKNSLLEGVELVFKKFGEALEKEGLTSLVSVGEEFDPEKHDALTMQEKEGVESGQIIEEYARGYVLNGKVIRHAQVIVAK